MSATPIPESWPLTKLQEEIELATRQVTILSRAANPRDSLIAEWRDYETRLRDRATVLGLTAELDALEGKS